MKRLWALLVAMGAAGFALSSPFLLETIRGARLPVAPAVALALQFAPITAGAATAIIAGNAVPGLTFGWLYRRRGLEAAMLAHGAADVWLQGLLPALLA